MGPKIYFVLFCYIWRASGIKIQNFLQPWWTSPVQKVYFILCGLPWTSFNHYNIVKFPWGRIYHNKWYVTCFDFGPAQSELGRQVIHPLPVSSSDWLASFQTPEYPLQNICGLPWISKIRPIWRVSGIKIQNFLQPWWKSSINIKCQKLH